MLLRGTVILHPEQAVATAKSPARTSLIIRKRHKSLHGSRIFLTSLGLAGLQAAAEGTPDCRRSSAGIPPIAAIATSGSPATAPGSIRARPSAARSWCGCSRPSCAKMTRFHAGDAGGEVSIAVEDAPFMAVLMAVEGEGETQRLTFTTNVGDRVTAGAGASLCASSPIRQAARPSLIFMCAGGWKPSWRGRSITRWSSCAVTQGRARSGVWSGGVFFVWARCRERHSRAPESRSAGGVARACC